MSYRVTEDEVSAVIKDYVSSVDLDPMIIAANALTTFLSSKDSAGVLTATLLKEIERHLAAHMYDATDHEAASEHTGKSTTKFTGLYGKGCLDGTRHGKLAMLLDVTGYLSGNINAGARNVGVAWLGLPPSEQTDYVDRD